jgi:prepilin-type N-terminal cleavage/methylation domain-containing protein/prepilin-type processing-associated H-X9-DG protein
MRRGFTLIELLVVIAIIAILAAILFPVFARAREKARQSSCLSNVKQITLGLEMYNTDYDGYWPCYHHSYMTWPELVMPYVKNEQIFVCPSHGATGTAPLSYAANDSTSKSFGQGPWVYGTYVQNRVYVEAPAETGLILEWQTSWDVYQDGVRHSQRWPGHNMYIGHNGGSNVGFADGHAKWMRPDQTVSPDHHPTQYRDMGGGWNAASYDVNIWDRSGDS